MWLVCFVVIVWFVFGVYLLAWCSIAVWYLFVGCWLFGEMRFVWVLQHSSLWAWGLVVWCGFGFGCVVLFGASVICIGGLGVAAGSWLVLVCVGCVYDRFGLLAYLWVFCCCLVGCWWVWCLLAADCLGIGFMRVVVI